MIGQECIDELADFAGLKAQVVGHHRARDARRDRFRAGVARTRRPAEGPAGQRRRRSAGHAHHPDPGRPRTGPTMRANGAYTCLVSGGFTLFTDAVAGHIGFDENHANVLLTQGDRLPATVAEPILGREAKLATLARTGATAASRRDRHACGRRRRQRSRHAARPPGSASPSTPSPQSRRPPPPASTMAISPRCSMRRAIGGTSL